MFAQGTRLVDFTVVQERFRKMLPVGSRILDFGCGSDHDTKYFLEKGYQVAATDGSSELCKLASAFTGIEVKETTPSVRIKSNHKIKVFISSQHGDNERYY